MGIVYYLLGEIEKAAHHHDKGIDQIIDKNEQLLKDNTIEALRGTIKKNPLSTNQLDRNF